MVKASLDGICDESEHRSVLLSAGLDHREHRFDESASGDTLCPERKFSPDHSVTKGSLGCVVGGFDVLAIDERPEIIEMGTVVPSTDLTETRRLSELVIAMVRFKLPGEFPVCF